jgi:2-polyprenyl-3-methyl-5-hydroxy-6-metoxy-1,4-benzoquinol methylase
MEDRLMGALVPLYRQMAADGESFRGLTILQHRKLLAKLCRQHFITSALDYGCGAGQAYRSPHRMHKDLGLHWFDVELYDPAFPEHDEKPSGKWGAVFCCDVLEHVPQDEVDELVRTLYSHAREFVWASVCCRPAKKWFPDGTNMHVTQRPLQWWLDKFEEHRPRDRDVRFYLVETP